MSLDLEKRTERLEKIQDQVFSKMDELHVTLVSLSSKVGNGLTASAKTHTIEIGQLKSHHAKLVDELAIQNKDFEVRHIRLSADLSMLQNNIVKDIDQLKREIAQQIRAEGAAFLERLGKHRDEEQLERTRMEIERQGEMSRLASERKLYIIIGTICVTIVAPLIIRIIDGIVISL